MVRNSHYIDPSEPKITSVTTATCEPEPINPALGHISRSEGKHRSVNPAIDKYKKWKLFKTVSEAQMLLDPCTEPKGLLRETLIILVSLEK